MVARKVTERRVGAPLRVGGVTIVPVEEVGMAVQFGAGRLFASAGRRVVAVVVIEGGVARALDDAGRALDLDHILEQVPPLRDALRESAVASAGSP